MECLPAAVAVCFELSIALLLDWLLLMTGDLTLSSNLTDSYGWEEEVDSDFSQG